MLSASRPFERIAHRGAPREHTENTLPGFLVAIEHGADAIELDVHLTSDGKVVVHHDFDLRGVPLRSMSWDEVAAIELPGGGYVPLLEDVLTAIGDKAVAYVELKGRGIEREVAAMVRAHASRYALHSFDHAAIRRVASSDPDIPRGILIDKDEPRVLDVLRDAATSCRPRDVWPHHTLVDKRFMAAAEALGLRVITWTVNAMETATRLRDIGVAGICTDDVRLLANL